MLALAGCARGTGDGSSVVIPTVTGLAPGVTLVAEWSETGGFTMPGEMMLRPPRLMVYADGTAIADAERSLTLDAAELSSLVGAQRSALAGLGASVKMGAGRGVADATDAVLRVRLADGALQSVTAYALEPDLGYPARLVAAKQRMTELWRRVMDRGTPYASAQVRVVGDPTQYAGGQASAWPRSVPLPAATPDSWGTKLYVIEATDAGAVKAAWPANRWTASTLPDGTVINVSWRYLVPGE